MAFSVEGWIDDQLSHVKVSGGGDEREATCPACGKHGSFYINASTGAHVCFSCDFKGRNLTNVIAEVEGISHSEARRRLLKGIVDFVRIEPETLLEKIAKLRKGDDEDKSVLGVEVPLPKEFVPVKDERGRWRFPAYLSKRGVKREIARAFGLGFCRSGDYSQRILFPIVCPNGYSFTARDITGKQEPRYRNPKGAGLGRLLYGWHTLKPGRDFLIVEGPMDAIMANQHGYSAISLLGKSLGHEQLEMLGSMELGAAIVMLDPEEGAAPVKAAIALKSIMDDVFIATLPDGKDPGDATFEEIGDAFDDAKRFNGERVARALGALKDMRRKLEKMYSQN